jgi:hypothetical protein
MVIGIYVRMLRIVQTIPTLRLKSISMSEIECQSIDHQPRPELYPRLGQPYVSTLWYRSSQFFPDGRPCSAPSSKNFYVASSLSLTDTTISFRYRTRQSPHQAYARILRTPIAANESIQYIAKDNPSRQPPPQFRAARQRSAPTRLSPGPRPRTKAA